MSFIYDRTISNLDSLSNRATIAAQNWHFCLGSQISLLAFTLLAYLLLASGCKKTEDAPFSSFGTDQEFAIKTANGAFFCADQHQGNAITANKTNINSWEKFTVEKFGKDNVAIRASNLKFVGYRSTEGDLLVADQEEIKDRSTFKVIKVEPVGFVLRATNNRFVGVDLAGVVRADQERQENAAIFTVEEPSARSTSEREVQFSYFTIAQLTQLAIGLTLLMMSMILFNLKEDKQLSVILLVLGGLVLRIFMALLDPHLNLWDEQFHVLVAKNMMSDPFRPMLLKDPVLPYKALVWTDAHIWLHKQPLFLWQMALSMKAFGATVFAARLPSVLMSTAVIYFIYRAGELTVGKSAGFIGALIFSVSHFSLELVSGAIGMDHNDIAFFFYISASICTWLEYENAEGKRKTRFMVLIGLFVGCAILVKWLTGLLVFAGWGLTILLIKERRINKVHYVHLLTSLLIAVVVFMPWQLYILNAFPEISQHEFRLNSTHFFTAVEGHGGNSWYHFEKSERIYGVHMAFLFLSVLIMAYSIKSRVFRIGLVSFIVIIYMFFTLAETKILAYTYCIAFLIFLAIGAALNKLFELVLRNPDQGPKKIYPILLRSVVLILLCGVALDIGSIQKQHTTWVHKRGSHYYNRSRSIPILKDLQNALIEPNKYVLINTRHDENEMVMFFVEVASAYDLIPDEHTVIDLKARGYKIAAFNDGQLPAYLLEDHDIVIVDGYWDPR